jgi:hypothetical protein
VSSTTTPPFKLDCPDCRVVKEFSGFEEARKFADKHRRHTDHKMDWERVEFDQLIPTEVKWRLACEECDKEWEFDNAGNAEQFRKEHGEVTDHEIDDGPEEIEVNVIDGDTMSDAGLKEVIARIEEEYEEGAPLKAVYGVVTANGVELSDAQEQVESLRVKGEVYEPKSGHLRTT